MKQNKLLKLMAKRIALAEIAMKKEFERSIYGPPKKCKRSTTPKEKRNG